MNKLTQGISQKGIGTLDTREVYIIGVNLENSETYYLVDLDFTISKSKKDAVIFINKNNAYKLSSIVETKYKNSLGQIIKENIQNVIY